MNTVQANRLVPEGYFTVFVPAPDETVDDEYEIHDANGNTGVSFQLTGRYMAVSKWDASDESVTHWSPRAADQAKALRQDVLLALQLQG